MARKKMTRIPGSRKLQMLIMNSQTLSCSRLRVLDMIMNAM
jgi:hypothetical protein